MRLHDLDLSSYYTDTAEQRYGYRFELWPPQSWFEIDTAKLIAQEAIERQVPIHVIDAGCGNGNKGHGITKVLRHVGFRLPVYYSGIDIDMDSVEEVKRKMDTDPEISVCLLKQGNLTDETAFSNFCTTTLSIPGIDSALHLVLFEDVLHWLHPSQIESVLDTVYTLVPQGTHIIAAACSVWNRTSLGYPDNPILQRERYIQTRQLVLQNPDQPLWRYPGEIENEHGNHGPMTHFTPHSISSLFKRSGFSVVRAPWINNLYFPNGYEYLPENVGLCAVR